MTAEIREFRLTDLDGYVEMSNSSCRDDPDFKEVTAEDVRRNILDSADYRPEGHFVAVEGGRVVGKGRGIWTPQVLQARGPVGWMELLVEPANDNGLPAAQRTICRIIRETPGIKQKDIAAQMGVTSSTVSYHLQKLVARGMVEAKRRGMSVRYRLNEGSDESGSLGGRGLARENSPPVAEKGRLAETRMF